MQDAYIQSRVQGPGIALMVTGVIGILTQGMSALAQSAQLVVLASAAAQQSGPEVAEQLVPVVIALGIIGVSCLVGLFLVYGGWKLHQGESWMLGAIASGLAMVPCLSPCCIFGLPAGIWGLMVLLDPEVKLAFEEEELLRPRY